MHASEFIKELDVDINLDTPIFAIRELSARIINCLEMEQINTVRELLSWYDELSEEIGTQSPDAYFLSRLHVPGFGVKSFIELKDFVCKYRSQLIKKQ